MEQELRRVYYDPELGVEACLFQGIDQGFPEHFHTYYVIGTMDRGSREVTIAGETLRLAPGELVFFQPGEPHACRPVGEERLDWRGLHVPQEVMERAAEAVTGRQFAPHFTPSVLPGSELTSLFREVWELVAGEQGELRREEAFLLLVGRLLEAKGLPEYAAAAKELKTQYPAARFQLLGPPEQGLGSVDLAQVRRWQDEGSIEYLGETRDVRPYVEACHALVLPSWREGTPTSIMEGMSMGRAAVVTDVPGCREVVEDGVNGCICAAHDPRALAAAMRRLLDEPGLLVRMGAAGRDLACREFDAEVVAEKILVDMRVPRAAG